MVEIIIYIGLIGIVLTGFVTLAMLISTLKTKNLIMREVNQSARQALEVISQRAVSASSIDSPLPGRASSTFALTNDSSQYKFELKSGVLNEIKDSVPEEVNNSRFQFANLVFTNLGSTTTPSIRIEFDVGYQSSDSQEFNYSNSYQSAITPRL